MENHFKNPQVIDFITQNWTKELTQLAFQLSKSDLPKVFILNQIQGKQKSKEKLPIWFQNNQILFPKKISIEQSSSEITAKYKADLLEGNTLIDLTGGFGVDDYFFAKNFKKVFHCELNEELHQIVKHNATLLNQDNIDCIQGDSLDFLKTLDSVDAIFVDPARRNDAHQKVFRFEDCLPNIVENFDFLLQKTNHLLVKASPMIDLSQGLQELSFVKKIIVVAVKNECKEVLFLIEKNFLGEPIIECVELGKDIKPQSFSFSQSKEKETEITYSLPSNYLYEPNTSILKAGAYKCVTEVGITKIGQHSHLYTSDTLVRDFMGRSFEIQETCSFDKKLLLKKVGKKTNITTRNFPYTVNEIRKKTGIKEGGELYVFCTTSYENKPICIICKKVRA